MGARLSVDIGESNQTSIISLSGIIDEDNDLSGVTASVGTSSALIETAGIERINSCGVRDWVNWLGQLAAKGVDYYLVQCAPAIIAQVNLVNNFVGAARIISFYAPYYCGACDADHMLLIDTSDADMKLPFAAPACRCEKCDQLMEFDDIEASYFAFLKSNSEKALPDASILELARSNAKKEGRARSRPSTLQLSPVQAGPTPVGDQFAGTFTTTPSAKVLRGLLTDASLGPPTNPDGTPADVQGSTGRGASKLLYVIIALLVLAVGLLSVIVIRSL